jgi:hypothetical protein
MTTEPCCLGGLAGTEIGACPSARGTRLRAGPARAAFGLLPRVPGNRNDRATWLILPVVICLSQRLSHACLSIRGLCSLETANGSLNQLLFI